MARRIVNEKVILRMKAKGINRMQSWQPKGFWDIRIDAYDSILSEVEAEIKRYKEKIKKHNLTLKK